MAPIPENSIWSQMDYTPPRGLCNFKTGMLTTCTCLRFMLHPIKSATSFECDGCNHHASYHSMENASDNQIIKRWQAEEEEKENPNASIAARPKKKPRRAIENRGPARLTGVFDGNGEGFVVEELDSDTTTATGAVVRKRGRAKK